jgi:hypothetical protein
MEVEDNKEFSLLDVFMTKKPKGFFSHQVHRKKTHTEHYLHVDSYHHLSQTFGVLNTLVTQALRIYYDEHLVYE